MSLTFFLIYLHPFFDDEIDPYLIENRTERKTEHGIRARPIDRSEDDTVCMQKLLLEKKKEKVAMCMCMCLPRSLILGEMILILMMVMVMRPRLLCRYVNS